LNIAPHNVRLILLGHSGDARNEGADLKADEGADKESSDRINLVEQFGVNPRRVKLQSLPRKLAYHAIGKHRMKSFQPRKAAALNTEYARDAVEEVTGKPPTSEKLWSFTEGKALTMKQKQFLWKIAHDAYKVARYWKNIPASQQVRIH
jgi:nucleoid-associated protein YgaU